MFIAVACNVVACTAVMFAVVAFTAVAFTAVSTRNPPQAWRTNPPRLRNLFIGLRHPNQRTANLSSRPEFTRRGGQPDFFFHLRSCEGVGLRSGGISLQVLSNSKSKGAQAIRPLATAPPARDLSAANPHRPTK
jgi:hypothetical protein